MTDKTPRELEPHHREKLEAISKHATDLTRAADTRWTVAITVGNGAGLLSVASAVLSKEASLGLMRLLMPTCWLFAIGLLAAGAALGVDRFRLGTVDSEIQRAVRKTIKGTTTLAPQWVIRVETWGSYVSNGFFFVSAAAFAVGLIRPLWYLTKSL